jgi:hypothetical protein
MGFGSGRRRDGRELRHAGGGLLRVPGERPRGTQKLRARGALVRNRWREFFYLTDAPRLEGARSARRAALRDACRRMRLLRCCALLMDLMGCSFGMGDEPRRLVLFSPCVRRHPGPRQRCALVAEARRLRELGSRQATGRALGRYTRGPPRLRWCRGEIQARGARCWRRE